MKRLFASLLLFAVATASLTAGASAVETPAVRYPVSVTISEDKSELRKVYHLSPEDDPSEIPSADFDQDGYHYKLQDILWQEEADDLSREQTETAHMQSDKNDLESVLALLPAEKPYNSDDGFTGILALQLDTVQVEPTGYGTTTKKLNVTRSYPNLDSQDTQYIPKSIEDNGHALTLQNIQWQTDNAANVDGYALADRYTAIATYTGSATSSYVKGYTVTADYSGTVSKTEVTMVQYTAIFSGTQIEPEKEDFHWQSLAIPGAALAAAGGATAIILRTRKKRKKGLI